MEAATEKGSMTAEPERSVQAGPVRIRDENNLRQLNLWVTDAKYLMFKKIREDVVGLKPTSAKRKTIR
jgi:hypothetical protein